MLGDLEQREAKMDSTHTSHDSLSLIPDSRRSKQGHEGTAITRRSVMAMTTLGLFAGGTGAAFAGAKGQITWGIHVSLAPGWFDPAETGGVITPFMLLYALHEGLMKPMPGNPAELCL